VDFFEKSWVMHSAMSRYAVHGRSPSVAGFYWP